MVRTYMPLLPAAFRLENQFVQPWVRCCSPILFWTDLKYLDIDLNQRWTMMGQ